MGIFDFDIFGGDHRESAHDAVDWQSFQDAALRDLTTNYSPLDYRIDVEVQRRADDGTEFAPDFVVRDEIDPSWWTPFDAKEG